MKPSGIELATFRLVAQCLNELRHCLPCHLQGVFLQTKDQMSNTSSTASHAQFHYKMKSLKVLEFLITHVNKFQSILL